MPPSPPDSTHMSASAAALPSPTHPSRSATHQSIHRQATAHPTRSSAAASHDKQAARRVSKKLQKRLPESSHTPTMELPERLKDNGGEADNEEEVLQPHGMGGGMFMNMNQSIFGLIAAAGSRVDFTDRFEGQSSDEEGDEGPMSRTELRHGQGSHPREGREASGQTLAQTTVLRKPGAPPHKSSNHRRKFSESKLLRSVPGLSKLTTKSRSKSKGKAALDHQADGGASSPSSSTPASPSIEVTRAEGRLAPVLSRMLEARAEMAARPSFDLERHSSDHIRDEESGDSGPRELAKRLKEIFEFEEPEEVIAGE